MLSTTHCAAMIWVLTISLLILPFDLTQPARIPHARQVKRETGKLEIIVEKKDGSGPVIEGLSVFLNGRLLGGTKGFEGEILDLPPGVYTVEIVFPDNTHWVRRIKITALRLVCVFLVYDPSYKESSPPKANPIDEKPVQNVSFMTAHSISSSKSLYRPIRHVYFVPQSPFETGEEVIKQSSITGSISSGCSRNLTPDPTPTPAPKPPKKPSQRKPRSRVVTDLPGGGEPPSELPSLSQAEIDYILSNMPWGRIAFNKPDTMGLKEHTTFALVLHPNPKSDVPQNKIQEMEVSGKIRIEEIKISDEMEARLTGADFDIKNILPESQVISGIKETEWRWDVQALKPGNLTLHLTLSALVKVNGKDVTYPIQTYKQTYEISVPWYQKHVFAYVANNWQWLWTTMFVPFSIWIWNRRKKKGGKTKPRISRRKSRS